MAYYEHVDLHSLEKTPPHKRNLNLLRNAKDLQCTLQKDDLVVVGLTIGYWTLSGVFCGLIA